MFSRLTSVLLFTALILSPVLLQAQALFSGHVHDAATEQPLEGVTITASTGEQGITNENGYFSLATGTPPKRLVFSYVGYARLVLSNPDTGQELQVQLQPAEANLQEVVITGYETNRPLLQTAGAISLVGREAIERFDESSVVRAVNMVPGVRMEERAPASYRLSVRGSTLRSPYGIRNVKVYYDGIPFTEANGTSALNLLDANNIERIEVLKGPTGSIYGAGTGGTVLLEPRRAASGERSLQLESTVGSYGLQRHAASVNMGTEKSKVLVQYTNYSYDGYREQSAVDRDVLLISSAFKPSEKRTVSANIIYSNLYYELPGGLTEEQYDQDPRQARGGMFGSVAQNASIDLEGINVGLKQTYTFNERLRNTSSLYGLYKFKDNPFNTDYERNTNQEFGGRTSFVYDASIGSVQSHFTLGGEFQRGFEVARTYDNNGGTPDGLRTDDEVVAKTGLLFAQAEFELPADIIATAALSLNDTRYKITRLQQAGTDGFRIDRDFEAVLSPRVAVLKQLSERVSVHASVSAGFSPPTEEEILTSDGQLNEDLEAEKGINYEAGIRGYLLGERLYFDAVAFYLKLDETIVSVQEASSVAVFRNVGSTKQKGLELSANYTLWDEPAQQLQLLKAWASYTYSHFRFDTYADGENDFSGNDLTGVAPHTATFGLDLYTRLGLYLNLTANYVDEIPLRDDNTVYSDSYLVAGARAGWERKLSRQFGLEVFAGIDNATDEKYSLGNDLNAFGGRYFQPAPGRNYFGGVKLKYNL